MCPVSIVVGDEGADQLAQVALAQDDDVVEQFAADHGDEAFGDSILPVTPPDGWYASAPPATSAALLTPPENMAPRSKIMKRGAESNGKADELWEDRRREVGRVRPRIPGAAWVLARGGGQTRLLEPWPHCHEEQ